MNRYHIMVTWKNQIVVEAKSKKSAIDIARENIDGFPDIDRIDILDIMRVERK